MGQMWSDEQLDSAEELVLLDESSMRGVKRPWVTAAYVIAPVPEDLTALGVVGYFGAPEFRKRSKYCHSKWVVVEWRDTLRPIPELFLRALALKNAPLTVEDLPFWGSDGQIQVATRALTGYPGRPPSSKYGIPSSTKEYRKRYGQDNKERMRAASNRYQQKLRDKAPQGAKNSAPAGEPVFDAVAEMARRMGVPVEEFRASLEPEASSPESASVECPRCGTDMPSGVGAKCEWCGYPEGK